jgi:predicted DCC family thiol-disulfide oxidoreductase YuxK
MSTLPPNETAASSSSSASPTSIEWTGGQFSVLRAFIGSIAVVHAFALAPAGYALASLMSLGAALSIVVGWQVGSAAAVSILLLLMGPAVGVSADVISRLGLVTALSLLGRSTPAPYGSVAAIGRKDPGGAWSQASLTTWGIWVGLGGMWFIKGLTDWSIGAWPLGLLELAAPAFFFFRSQRLIVWLTLLGLLIGQALAAEMNWGLLALHFLAFTPAWFPPRSFPGDTESPDVVFYDGDCALCHGIIRFTLAEIQVPNSIVFAPLGGAKFREVTDAIAGYDDHQRPDAVAIASGDGALLLWRSEAVLRLLNRLGGLWRVLAWIGALLPRSVNDALYDRVATSRKSVFGTTDNACPMMPEVLRSRMDLRA